MKNQKSGKTTMRRAAKIALPLILLAILPTAAYADSGTPLMIASVIHLVFGNFFIGIVEGLIVALLYRRTNVQSLCRSIVVFPISLWNWANEPLEMRNRHSLAWTLATNTDSAIKEPPRSKNPSIWLCIIVMIGANYFSAWIGSLLLVHIFEPRTSSIDIYNLGRWLGAFVVASYLLTLLLEWPFVALCYWRRDCWLRKSVWVNFVAQTASYLVIFGWYLSVSETSLLTDATIVPLSEIRMPADILLYYRDYPQNDISVLNVAENRTRKIGSMPTNDEKQVRALTVEKSETDETRFDLIAKAYHKYAIQGNTPKLKNTTILPNFAYTEAAWEQGKRSRRASHGENAEFWTVPQYVPTKEKNDWKDDKEPWAFGQRLKNKKDGRMLNLALETPLVNWSISCHALLPNDQAISKLADRFAFGIWKRDA